MSPDEIVEELVGPLGWKLLAKVCEPYQAILDYRAGILPGNLAKSIEILAKIHELQKTAVPHKMRQQNLPGPSAKPIEPIQPLEPIKTLPNNNGKVAQPKPERPKLPMIGKKKKPGLPGVTGAPKETISSAYVSKSELRTHCPTCRQTQVGKAGHTGCKCLAKVESTMMPMGLKLNLTGLSKTQIQALLTSLRA